MGSYMVLILFALLSDGVSYSDTEDVMSISVMESNDVPLDSKFNKNHSDTMLWYFNSIQIVQLNGDPSHECLYEGPGGIFKDRLVVNKVTGSLTIKNTAPKHSGQYEAEIIRSKTAGKSHNSKIKGECNKTQIFKKMGNVGDDIKKFNLIVSGAFDSDKNKNEVQTTTPQSKETNQSQSPDVVAGIVVVAAVVLGVAIFGCWKLYRYTRTSRNVMKDPNQVPLQSGDGTENG